MVGAKRERTTRARAVEAAVAKIRAFHELGRSLPPRAAHRDVYGKGVIQTAAERLGMNADTVGKARAFADPQSGFTPAEVDELCRLIRAEQVAQDDTLPIFGRTHLIRLLSVPKPRRAALAKRAVVNAWSSAELEAAIAARYGTRTEGGRPRRVPRDALGLLVQIEGSCEKWGRWAAAVSPPTGPAAGGGATATLADLPPALHRKVRDVTRALDRLHHLVVDELVRRKKYRGVRKRFRPEEAGAGE